LAPASPSSRRTSALAARREDASRASAAALSLRSRRLPATQAAAPESRRTSAVIASASPSCPRAARGASLAMLAVFSLPYYRV
jgi:hypothetical protein